MKNKMYKLDSKYFDERQLLKVKCKHCGHRKAFPMSAEKTICTWCHNYIFRNDEDEARYRFKEKLMKLKRSEL